jgi:general secretion pathway protein D
MKKTIFALIALGAAALLFSAAAQTPATVPPDDGSNTNTAPGQSVPPPEMNNGNGGPPDAGAAPPDMGGQPADETPGIAPATPAAAAGGSRAGATTILPSRMIGAGSGTVTPSFTPPATGTNADAIRLNFRNAPLDEVLSYLSDAAGFIIVLDTPVHGSVSVISGQPMTKDEAVNLLNSVLNQNGYAAVRDGRTLTIMNKTDAMRSDIPVKVSNNPDDIPKSDEIVTQIIPIRFVDAGDLVKDLSAFVSPQATVVANDAGNSIVITDTQANIRHLVEIIRAIDNSAEATTEIRVFRLKYANPADVATELGNVFPNSTSGTQAPTQFRGGPGGFFARMMAANAANNSSSDRIKKATQVTAVPDARIQAVIVTAPSDLMEQIAGMMKDLDVPSDRDQHVYVFQMTNGDPQEAATVLQNMFQSSSSARGNTTSSTTSPLMQRSQNNTTTSGTTGTTTSGTGGMGAGGYGGGGGRTF